ncbi:MAG: NUDIX hydrolase [Gemmatimonadales bacterium]
MSRIERLAEALGARSPAVADPTGRSRAAVAIVLAPNPDAVLLIRRAERVGDRWSGQMAFPGGRWAPEDPDLLTTARRETSEEVGLDLTDARLLGQFDDSAPRSPSLPPVVVTPYLFAVDHRRPLYPNVEVAEAGWVPFDELLRSEIYRPFEYRAEGTKYLFPGYHLPIGVVWGMTERILTPILSLLR